MRPGMSPGTDCSPSMPPILRVPVRTIAPPWRSAPQRMAKEIGRMEISERKARDECGWKIHCNLDAMVDDSIKEFSRRASQERDNDTEEASDG